MFRETQKDIGSFTVTCGSVYVTDPCYTPGTWCQAKLENVLNGTWHGEVLTTNDTGGWGNRVSRLRAIHETYNSKDFDLAAPIDADIGVDAGMAGVFDAAKYVSAKSDGDDRYGSGGFYDDCCNGTNPASIIQGSGIVSSSGYGDGGYVCYVAKNSQGQIGFIEVVFIEEHNDNDEEDFDEEE